MTERTASSGTECERVSVGRKREDGSYILPTSAAGCECGSESFVELGEELPTGR